MTSSIAVWRALQKNAQNISLSSIKVLYNKDGLLVINKPYGIPVHSGPKTKKSLSDLFPELEKKLELTGKLELVNRLDKNVAGALLLAYKRDMAEYLSELYRKREIEKTYLAILVGSTTRVSGVLNGDVVEAKKKGQFKQILDEQNNSRGTETEFQILDNNMKSCLLCSFVTRTGYKHQIRVHTSELLNCPVLGDHKYHNGPVGPQHIPLRMLQMFKITGVASEDRKSRIRPWQRGLIPLHLFAQKVLIPGIDTNNKDLVIKAKLPQYFKESMKTLDLLVNREEYDMKQLLKKKRYFGHGEQLFKSKSVLPSHVSQETSL